MTQGSCFIDVAPSTTYRPVACPSPAPALPPGACERAEMCRGVSDEGCCVGCNHPMRTDITKACAAKIDAARNCAEVVKALGGKGCTLH
jgi:hypothetical protein